MQPLKPYWLRLVSVMFACILGHSVLASPVINTTELVSPDDTVVWLPLTSSNDISYRQERSALGAFICSILNLPANSTFVYGNSSEINALKNDFGCNTPNLKNIAKSKPDYDRWVSSVSIWAWQGLEMFILLDTAIKMHPQAKQLILAAASATSLITTGSLYITGTVLAAFGKKIPGKWLELMEGLTKLKASLWVGDWALVMAGGIAGKKEVVLSGLLINVISNTFRETGAGVLVTLPLFVRKKYHAALLSLIPLGVITAQLIVRNPRTDNAFVQRVTWLAIASLGAGLFSGAWHNFEEVAGESSIVWDIGSNITVGDDYEILSHQKLPMSIIAPFGYRPNPTVITLTSGLSYFTFITLASLYRFLHRAQCTMTQQATDLSMTEL
ncbi:hypothetical protein [Endozoicomonas sp. 4G]|uniref:hypothetical protein n=1 Tax=Endozoicomonas sp. 4G TaxID=2872754 RepID=UPI0020791AC0|nr:hypothetical protein [Endozoicomonas sp. 4G]